MDHFRMRVTYKENINIYIYIYTYIRQHNETQTHEDESRDNFRNIGYIKHTTDEELC
jgi:hypothetical protein